MELVFSLMAEDPSSAAEIGELAHGLVWKSMSISIFGHLLAQSNSSSHNQS